MKKVDNVLFSNTSEIFRLRNHNKTLITKIKKLKHGNKREQSGEDLEGKLLENQEENQCLNNSNQELHNQIKEIEIEKKSQEEGIEKIQNHNNLLDIQEAQIEEVKSSSQSKRKKNKQHLHLTDILIIIIILTNDKVKMNIHRRLMWTCENIDIPSNN